MYRVALSALDGVRRVVLFAGVFLFAFALTALAVAGSGHRTLKLEYTHDTQVPASTSGWDAGK